MTTKAVEVGGGMAYRLLPEDLTFPAPNLRQTTGL